MFCFPLEQLFVRQPIFYCFEMQYIIGSIEVWLKTGACGQHDIFKVTVLCQSYIKFQVLTADPRECLPSRMRRSCPSRTCVCYMSCSVWKNSQARSLPSFHSGSDANFSSVSFADIAPSHQLECQQSKAHRLLTYVILIHRVCSNY